MQCLSWLSDAISLMGIFEVALFRARLGRDGGKVGRENTARTEGHAIHISER